MNPEHRRRFKVQNGELRVGSWKGARRAGSEQIRRARAGRGAVARRQSPGLSEESDIAKDRFATSGPIVPVVSARKCSRSSTSPRHARSGSRSRSPRREVSSTPTALVRRGHRDQRHHRCLPDRGSDTHRVLGRVDRGGGCSQWGATGRLRGSEPRAVDAGISIHNPFKERPQPRPRQ